MKKGLLLNRALSDLVAACGHVDEIVVADAGMPAPPGVRVIDLALMRGVPSFWQVLEALRSELVIEGVVIAEETSAGLLTKMTAELACFDTTGGAALRIERASHEALKDRSQRARAFVRTNLLTGR